MKRGLTRGCCWGGLLIASLMVAVANAHAGTTAPTSPPAVQGKLERLRVAVAPLGWDTNYTWLQSRSGQLDKRPALEYLIGIDRHTGAD